MCEKFHYEINKKDGNIGNNLITISVVYIRITRTCTLRNTNSNNVIDSVYDARMESD